MIQADKQRHPRNILLLIGLLALGLSGCTFTQKTTVENRDGQEVRRTSYGVDFHLLSTDDSDDD